tara:strand:+ start:649 stop:936 length:288 start_codon:yes stop_codon:yes gene_type:complete
MSSYYTDLDDALGADEEAEQYLRQRALERRRDQLRILRITVNTVKNTPVRGAKVEVKCSCGNIFTARKADVARGWGKYCSKSCKSTYKNNGKGWR